MASRSAARPSLRGRGVPGPHIRHGPSRVGPPDAEWQTVTWGTGTAGAPHRAVLRPRVRADDGTRRAVAALRTHRSTDDCKFHLLNLAPTPRSSTLVAFARSRWPIEQQYRELKDDLGLDHFEGRSYQRLAASRRAHRRGVHLPATRTRARRPPRPPALAAHGARMGPRNLRPALRHPQSPPARHARQLPPQPTATKVTK